MSGTFFFGDWQVEPAANTLRRGKLLQQLEPKAMDVLVLLCKHSGEVLSSDDIVSQCWPDTDTGDNPLHKTINQLRRALGDTATRSSYIETIRKRGYRTLAEVRFPLGQEQSAQPQSWQGGSPFPGLQAYDARYAKVFFGRGVQIDTLLQRIAQQVQYGRAFCLLLGPSGSGKSSLINAGVMPNLMQSGGYNGIQVMDCTSLDLADVAQQQLFSSLASALLDWELAGTPVFDGESADSLAQRLLYSPEQVLQQCRTELTQQSQSRQRFALFVDRLEVLLSSPLFSTDERKTFVDLLELFANSDAVLVLSACRNEFYPSLVAYPSLMAGKGRGAHFDLAPPGRAELLQMIRLPALAANLSWDTDPDTATPLDEMLCSEAASNPDALPMLQYTLQELYLQRSKDNRLLVSVYKALGGIEGAIGKNAEQAIKQLTTAQKASLPRVLSLLVTLREDEQTITSRSGRVQQLQTDDERMLVKTMVEHRLFVSHLQNGEPCFSIAHEALLRRWPRATAWITEHHDSLSVKSRLHHLTNRWQAEGKNSAYLLAEGKPLQEALLLANNRLFQLDAEESCFIQASAKKARMLRWGRRMTVALLCVLTFTAVMMSFKSFEAEQQAQQKRLAAENLLGFMVGEFADKLRSIGRMDLLDGISNKALEYFSDLSDEEENQFNFDARFQHGQTLAAMGEVAYSRDKLDEAHAALQASQYKLLPLLGQQPDNLALLKTLGANAFWLGQLKYDKSDWAGSRPLFEQYLSYSQQMYDIAPDDKDALMELSYAHNTLGSVSMKQQNFVAAQQDFEKSLQLKLLALAKEPDNNQLLADVANARSWLASAALANGALQEVIGIHEDIQSSLAAVPAIKQDSYLTETLAISYHQSSLLLQHRNQNTNARKKAELAYELLTELIRTDPDNQTWRIQLYQIKFILLKLQPVNEEVAYRQDPDLLMQALRQDKNSFVSSPRSQVLEPLLQQAIIRYFLQRDIKGQLSSHIKAVDTTLSQLQTEYPDNLQYKGWYAELHLLKALYYKQDDKLDMMQQACELARQVLQPIQAINKEPRYIAPYVTSLQCLGQLSEYADLLALVAAEGIASTDF
ncbi:DNA-binding winged helix-turn-helix (wHTH) protein/energy-coupling factor transporter ATP-binding protein EcfA2 [Rheinheimera pacifica]|uniref:nSTAND1 domain-containing NTPase n=1 Tax=Rheinheimera pacifica TaxID=173990 RepID=UPI0021681646|nr:winged helix-turn-helix domain-containing protein [Rheinheimera pacifica]MCS4306894.1 DNA-binding winged helix-turn-helix (wHTH) protein/energy-coupling factor transporter ATP-binding protein EcfA2 [Rheinheimera pacifica]